MPQPTKEERDQVLRQILSDETFRYSPVLARTLEYLVSRADEPTGFPAKQLAIDVFHAHYGSGFSSAEAAARKAVARLRQQLDQYFESPAGRQSQFRVTIPSSPAGGYRLAFVPKPSPPPTIRVFLCHSSGDKDAVRKLHERLTKDGFAPWLDEEDLLPGQEWEPEIAKAVRSSDVVLVCLSKSAITKQGFVQKEIKVALDIAEEKPEGTIFIIPLKLEECDAPSRLSRWQWVNLFDPKGYDRLLRSLTLRKNGTIP